MSLLDFLKLLQYKPTRITEPCAFDDGVQIVEFRRSRGLSASLEFGRDFNKKHRGYYFYFEVIDFNDYEEMDFIPLDSSRRQNVIYAWPKTDEEYKKLAIQVNNVLKQVYKRKKA